MKRLTTLLLLATAFGACKKDKTPPTAPTITTAAITNITTSSATAGGTITGNGGATITQSGIVWSKSNTTPTTSDSIKNSTTTSGSFTINLSNLDFNTSYYIRAFATNSVGTAYGDVVTLNTANDTTKVRFTYMGQTVTYGIIISSVTGRKWLDRNLGASAVATSITDTAGYGHYFQWGRLADGHQKYSTATALDTTYTLSSTDVPGHNKFIIPTSNPGRDWRDPQNDNLWQGSAGINNPCPSGWHVPTQSEWASENFTSTGVTGAFNVLKIPCAGQHSYLSPTVINAAGTQASCWSSTLDAGSGNTFAIELALSTANINNLATFRKGHGLSVRCIKD